MGPGYPIFVSEPAQGNDSYRYGENEPPGLCVISAPRLKVPPKVPGSLAPGVRSALAR